MADNCPQAKLVIKIDDDVFIQMFNVIDTLMPRFSNTTRKMVCIYNAPGEKNLKRSGGWTVDHALFPGLAKYPVEHCQGKREYN